ncbi:MAG: SCO family protein [Betaproteobacteria bacterium]|nr:MAG: SCO family protein [Betaproteobacteria bacterium]
MHFLRATVTALLVLAVAACGPAAPKFQGSDVTGIGYGRDFRLTDHTGKPRTLADFRGKVVVLFFGYTQCPDVCPTTLSELAATMQKLGPDAARVKQVVCDTAGGAKSRPALRVAAQTAAGIVAGLGDRLHYSLRPASRQRQFVARNAHVFHCVRGSNTG